MKKFVKFEFSIYDVQSYAIAGVRKPLGLFVPL